MSDWQTTKVPNRFNPVATRFPTNRSARLANDMRRERQNETEASVRQASVTFSSNEKTYQSRHIAFSESLYLSGASVMHLLLQREALARQQSRLPAHRDRALRKWRETEMAESRKFILFFFK